MIMLDNDNNRYTSQEAVMYSLYGQDCEPYYAVATGTTSDGLVYESWAVEGNENSQEYLIQDADGFWRRAYLGEVC